jgi:hypothetical protein
MATYEDLLKRYQAGERLRLGPYVTLTEGVLDLAGVKIELNVIDEVVVNEQGDVEVHRLGMHRVDMLRDGVKYPLLVADGAQFEDALVVAELLTDLARAIPYTRRRSLSGWPPGSVGDLSSRVGEDVRDLKISGYSDREIYEVANGHITLEELHRRGPKSKRGLFGRRKR